MSSLVCPKCGTLSVGRSKEEDVMRTRIAELGALTDTLADELSDERDLTESMCERIADLEAALAERYRMLWSLAELLIRTPRTPHPDAEDITRYLNGVRTICARAEEGSGT